MRKSIVLIIIIVACSKGTKDIRSPWDSISAKYPGKKPFIKGFYVRAAVKYVWCGITFRIVVPC